MDHDALHHLLTRVQSGMVSRHQLLGLDVTHGDIERMVRRRELSRVHPGVFVNHTGPLTPRQREWAAVLAAWPAALSHQSAVPGAAFGAQIHVGIAHRRTLRPIRGVTFHRIADLDRRVAWNASPPRIRPAEAVIDVMAAAPDVAEMFATLAGAANTGEVWPDSLREALRGRSRIPRRTLITAMVEDLEHGANSVLERRWLAVERAHALPVGVRQVRANAAGRKVIRDVVYEKAALVVELDGRAWHQSATARNRDATRDLVAATEGLLTVRLTYGQVFDSGCQTALQVAAILRRAGWRGDVRRCPNCA